MKTLIRLALVAAVVVVAFKWRDLRDWFAMDNASRLTSEYGNSLVFVEGKNGRGSGFICEIGGRKFVITNQHVIAGNPGAKFTLLDQSPIRSGQAAAAVGHDIMSFALLSDAKAMVVMKEVEKNARVGDEVVVLGNSDGDRVIKPLTGNLVGIGPDRVEVSAEFVHGNSGSPIIHVRSGKVIGIATYYKKTYVDPITGKRKDEAEIKRFGFRLDSVRQWQPVNWPAYNGEFQTVEKIKTRSTDLLKTLKAQSWSELSAINFTDPAIRGPLERFARSMNGQDLIKASFASAFKELISSLRSSCNADVAQAQTQLRYDYFRRELGEEQRLRELFYKEFDACIKVMWKQ